VPVRGHACPLWAGARRGPALLATTSPASGTKTSETLFVDSTSPTASPGATACPTSGSRTNTTSPICCWA
jgi:hypothetical protein